MTPQRRAQPLLSLVCQPVCEAGYVLEGMREGRSFRRLTLSVSLGQVDSGSCTVQLLRPQVVLTMIFLVSHSSPGPDEEYCSSDLSLWL